MKVSIAEAKNRLPQLIRAVEQGEPVTICRHGVPIADLVPTKSTNLKPKLGTLTGKIVEVDNDWWKPINDEELDDFLEGHH